MEEWFVYALRSLKDKNIYIGISRNPENRVKLHNESRTDSTKNRRPFILIFKEHCGSLKQAREKEKYYKSGSGREFLKKVIPR